MKKHFAVLAMIGALIGSQAQAQSYPNLVVKDGNGSIQTICAGLFGSSRAYCQVTMGLNGSTFIPWAMDSSGRGFVNVFNLPLDGNGYLKSGVYDAVNGVPVSLQSGTIGAPAGGVVSVQDPGAAISVSSGNVANSNAVASLAAVSGKTNYLKGFRCTASGATSASVVNLTVTGLAGGTLTFTFTFPAGVTTAAASVGVDNFGIPLPASAQNTAITVTLPAGGTGNTNASCTAWGEQA